MYTDAPIEPKKGITRDATDLTGGIKFVRGGIEKDGKPESHVNNPDEINIDMDDDDTENDEAEIEEGI